MASQITFPPLIPVIILLSMMVGAPFMRETVSLDDQTFDFDFIKANLLQYLVGSFILATVSAIILGLISYVILQKFKPDRKIPPL